MVFGEELVVTYRHVINNTCTTTTYQHVINNTPFTPLQHTPLLPVSSERNQASVVSFQLLTADPIVTLYCCLSIAALLLLSAAAE